MKFLLTSSGINNPSIADALAELLGKPVSESRALFVPTGVYPLPGGAASAWEAITGKEGAPLTDLVYVGVSAGSIAVTPYNCDDETATMVVDGAVTVVSEGEWALLEGA